MTKSDKEASKGSIDAGLGSMTLGSAGRAVRRVAAAMFLTGILFPAACGTHWSVERPPRTAGQIADDYRPEQKRAVVIAHIDVITDGRPGFGPIGNPMLLQLDEGEGVPQDKVPDLTIPDINALSVDDPDSPYYTGTYGPMLWRYAPPGLLAASIRPGTYDGMIVFYPDTLRRDRPVDSIPAPDRPLLFTPLSISGNSVVYIGDIEVKQNVRSTDLMLDRVRMDYAVVDRYAQTTADFRARYPQFQSAEIEKRLVAPIMRGD